ncbi:MAG TPA: DUF2062 domain-containing protein [Terracidiphilus sp.]|jgi:hypothetical protein
MKRNLVHWLCQGISPRRLALTLALGFAIGCIPVVGIPTLLCFAVALGFRLNLPAIQAANYAAMPLQLALLVPFVRLGGKIFPTSAQASLTSATLLHSSSPALLANLSALMALAGHALVAWLVVALPAVIFLTAALTVMLRRIPALASPSSGD